MLFRWRSMDQRRCTHQYTHQYTNTHKYTRGEITIKFNNGTLWANVLGIFSRTPAAQLTVRYGETSSLREDVWLLIKKHTAVVVFYFATVSFFLHFPPLCTGHSISIIQCAEWLCYMSAMIITTCLLTISCNNIVLTVIPALYASSVDHVI